MSAPLPVALITGTNSGLGLSLSVKLASNHQVFAGMRGLNEKKREALDKAATEAGVEGNITVLDLDVNSDESVEKAVKSMLEKTEGRCDVLINNAGFSLAGGVEMLSMDQIQGQFETNVFGVIRCQKAVLPTMRAQKSGKIINISSVGGVWGQPFNDVYCASKFALEGMAESQAAVFRQFGVRITNVQPGAIKSSFFANAVMPDMTKVPADYVPSLQSTTAAYGKSAGAGQTPDEVAQVILEKVIQVEEPPLKIQTSEVIMPVIRGQLVDVTGEFGVKIAVDRFMPKKEEEK